jgi:hypothetical protein
MCAGTVSRSFPPGAFVGKVFDHVEHADHVELCLERWRVHAALNQSALRTLPGVAQSAREQVHSDNVLLAADLLQQPQHVAGAATDLQRSEAGRE